MLLKSETIQRDNRVSFIHLSITICSVILAMLGLMGDDIFLNIAVSGPLIIAGISGFFLMFAIESRHLISHILDYKIINVRGFESTKESNSLFIQILICSFSLILVLFSIYSLSIRNYTGFVTSLFLASCLTGVLFGRLFGKSVGESTKPGDWVDLNQSGKYDEYLYLKSWLQGDLRGNLSLIQSRKVEQQKDLFLEEVFAISKNKTKLQQLMSKLREAVSEPGDPINNIIEKLFLITFKGKYSEWLSDILDFNKEKREVYLREALQSLLLLPSVYELLSIFSRAGGVRDSNLFNHLLTCSGRFASRLECLDLISHGSQIVSTDAGINPNIDENMQLFTNFISIKASFNHEDDFSPWWLLSVRSLLVSMHGSHEDTITERLKTYMNYINPHIEEWCYTLSDYFGGNFPLDKESSGSAKILMNIYEAESGIFEKEIMRLTWQSYLELMG